MHLQACLDQCSLGLLRQIAAAHAVPLEEPPARAEVVRSVLERMLEPGYLAQYLANLDPEARQALEHLAGEGGTLRAFVLERRLRRRSPEAVDTEAPAVLTALLQRGLLFRDFQPAGPLRGELYTLPDELLAVLPAHPAAAELALPAAEQPARTLRCSSSFNLFALASFIRRWRQREARAPQREGQLAALSRETAELAVELPGRSPRERWTLMAHIGLELRLFVRKEAGLEATNTLEERLGQGEAAEHRLWRAYLEASRWNDLERAGTRGSRFAGRTVDPASARAQVLDLVGAVPTDEWVLAADLERLVRLRAPDFLREGFEVASSRLVDLESGEVLGGAESWERVEAPLLSYLLGGPLFWLGLLEWGLGPDGWDRVRLTAPGRAWLDGSYEVLTPGPAPLKLTEERRIIASTRSDLGLLWQLEPYLELVRRGPPSEYSLTRGSFARGLEAGGSRQELARLLERAGGGPPPLAFSLALERWSARAGRYRLRSMVILTAEDEHELDELLGRSEVKPLIRERLGPNNAAVTAARATELAELLERLGQIPEVDAALRLMAGRRAYPALVDQQTLEALLFCIRLLRALDPNLAAEMPHGEQLAQRIEQALGPIAAPRIGRRARSIARKLRKELREGTLRG